MTETISRSTKGSEDRLITIAKALDGVVICSGTEADPTRSMVCVLDEDFPAVFAAMKRHMHEINERASI
ncbi:hypothetical protein E0H46_31875 [Rhizobium leguminosarum bv. viciae]|nr:hypothetical protein E0H46_31875 [Rhizobium leguminosarum bv. viciae]